jgi:hypothetical protein
MVVEIAASAVKSTVRAIEDTAPAVRSAAAFASLPIEVVSVVERVASRVVAVVIVDYVAVTPVKSPMMPAPPITSVPSDSERRPEREVRTAIPNSWIWIPARPRHDGISVYHPRIVGGDINDIRAGRLDADSGVLLCYGLLRRGPEIACVLRSPAHHLYRIHDVLLLVVVDVA